MKYLVIIVLTVIAIAASAFSMATSALAMTVFMSDETCPLCKTEFKAELAGSGTQHGMRLDLKPLGPIAAPWPVPVCPKCHFVLFSSELEKTDLAKLNKYVQSKEYQDWGKTRSSYFLMAKLLSQLGKEDISIAHVYLKASWQEEGSDKHLKEDLELSLKHFDAYLKKGPPQKEKEKNKETDEDEDEASAYYTAQLLKGELLRRLGRFDEAKVYLQELQKLKRFTGTFLGDIVWYEITLCEQKDSKPHVMSEASQTK